MTATWNNILLVNLA